MKLALSSNSLVFSSRATLDWRVYALLWFFALPLILFFVGWFNWFYALPAVLSLFSILLQYKPGLNHVEWPKELALFLFSLFLVVLSGNGEGNFQTYDHFKHNFIFADLVKYNWPVVYEADGEHLNYYLGYYIVPSLFGKFMGIQVVPIANLFYLGLGLYLCLSALTKQYHWTVFHLLLFIFFSASAFLVVLLRFIVDPDISILNVFDQVFLIWNGPWGRYPQIPVFDSLRWVPQHFMASLAFYVVYKAFNKPSPVLIAHFLALSLFWSVYVFASACLFILLDHPKILRLRRKELLSIIPSGFVILLVGLFFLFHTEGARNAGNFSFFKPESTLYLMSSLVAFSIPLLLIGFFWFGSTQKQVFKAWFIYLIGSVLLAVSGDFDLFARGTLIFQIALLAHVLAHRNWSRKLTLKRVRDLTIISVLFILPGIITTSGPSFYFYAKHKSWPKPGFTISKAKAEYTSIKEIYCAIQDAGTSKEGEKCDSLSYTQKYSGKSCFLLK